MNTIETAKLIAILQEYYPREVPATSFQAKVAAWELILSEYSYKEAQAAVVAWEKTSANGFCPTPGQLVGKIHELRKMDEMSEPEAWELVMNALRNSTYSSLDEYNKLPEPVRKAVGTAGQLKEWAVVDSRDLQTVIRSAFTKSFKAIQESSATRERLASIKDATYFDGQTKKKSKAVHKSYMDNNILSVETAWGDEWVNDAASIQVQRTDKFFEIARDLSNYIKTLPLTTEQNDRLVYLMVDQVAEAEHAAFLQGVRIGKACTETQK